MLIKQQALITHLRQKLAALYLLFGQDHFLLNQAADSIKSAWKKATNDESEEFILYINNPSDWILLSEKANSYSLFSTHLLIDIRYDKKTLEVAGKDFLTSYLKNINPSCLLLLRAANLPQKQIQGFVNLENAHMVQASPLPSSAMQQWIAEQLQQKKMSFEPQVPGLIHLYTQGNMLACAQVIEKLELINDEHCKLTIEFVKEQLVDQCDYQLFELAEACLSNNPTKVIQLLRHAHNTKVEPTLVLWLLAQEIRLLIQLEHLTKQSISFSTACSQLKIWPQRAKIYQATLNKSALNHLLQLLQFCKLIDERIKSSQSNQIWQSIEQVALSLCLAKEVGSFA